MPKYDHHICLVSHQNVAELLGAMLPGAGAGAVHAIVTPQMRKQAEAFKKACQKLRIKCSLYDLPMIGIVEMHNLLDCIWFEDTDGAWAINITGGTKIMSLAAYTWAERNKIPIFYVDTDNKSVMLYEEGSWGNAPLAEILNFESLLNVYGYDIKSKVKTAVSAGTRAAAEKLIELGSRKEHSAAFRMLNDRAASALNAPDMKVSYDPDPRHAEVLDVCKKAEKLDFTQDAIIFRDDESRKWCNGIWLEEYVQSVLARLESEGRIFSWASSVNIHKDEVPNELDAIFTAHNRLHVLECKTSRMQGGQGLPPTSILYKADSVNGRVGGIFTRSMICSLNPLPPHDMQRAADMGIKTVCGANLGNLRKLLIEWIETA